MITIDADKAQIEYLESGEWQFKLLCGAYLYCPFFSADAQAIFIEMEKPQCGPCELDCPIKEYVHGV